VPTPHKGPSPTESNTAARLARAGEKAGILAEALPWMQRFHGKIVVVKYGGNAMVDDELKQAFARDMVFLRLAGIPVSSAVACASPPPRPSTSYGWCWSGRSAASWSG